MSHRFTLLFALVAGSCGMCHAQSFNIDLDGYFGTEQTGNGAPSNGFGGPAGQPGFWNRVFSQGPGTPTVLSGLDGVATPVTIQATGGTGSYGGYNNTSFSGDFRLLMADFASVGLPIQYHFSGVNPGHYSIYVCGGNPSGATGDLLVSVPGSLTPTQTITGPVPANLFLEGIDFSRHELDLTGSSFEIDVSANAPPYSAIAGFQVVYVPVCEPSTVALLAVGAAGLVARRRRRM